MLKTSLHWLAAAMFGGLGVRNPASLLDNAPLRELLSAERALRRHPARDRARATSTPRGHGVGLCDGALRDVLPGPPELASGRACAASAAPTKLTIDHLMASAAVPFVFPPVQIGGRVLRRRLDAAPRAAVAGDPSRRRPHARRRRARRASRRRAARPARARSGRRSRIWAATCSTRCSWTVSTRTSSGYRGTNRILEQLGTTQAPGPLGESAAAAHARHRAAAGLALDRRASTRTSCRAACASCSAGLGASSQQRHAARELSAVRVGFHARADRHGLSRRDGDGGRAARVPVRSADGHAVRARAPEARAAIPAQRTSL